MITNTQRRNQILRRISKIPHEKLKELDDYVSKLEKEISNNSKTMSYAGAWQDIDESVFDDLTRNLITNRQKNRGRING
jgi:hypothetical protein